MNLKDQKALLANVAELEELERLSKTLHGQVTQVYSRWNLLAKAVASEDRAEIEQARDTFAHQVANAVGKD